MPTLILQMRGRPHQPTGRSVPEAIPVEILDTWHCLASCLIGGRFCGRRGWWWDESVFGAEVRDQLRRFLIGEGIAERRHLLSAVINLSNNFGGRPELVFAQVYKRRRLLAADTADSMAVGATLIAKQDCSGPCGGFAFGAQQSVGVGRGEKQER